MPSLWMGETESYTDEEKAEFNNMINDVLSRTNYSGNYINYSEEVGMSPYTDFIDITHLTLEVADEFSKYINNRVFGDIE